MNRQQRLKALSPVQVEHYGHHGFYAPIPVLSPDQVVRFRSGLEEMLARLGGERKRVDHCQLFFRWAYDLVTHPAILDVIEDLLGPDILVQSTRVFCKPPHDPAYVSWHQDGRYSGLNACPALTAWIALSDSTIENGCLRVVPGSHKQGLYPHTETEAKDNLVNHGQEVAIDLAEAHVKDVILKAGQMSVHHVNLIHGSEPNRSDTKRIGFSVSYITPEVQHSALPVIRVRGRDDYDHLEFLKEPPSGSLEEGIADHAEYLRQHRFHKASPDSTRRDRAQDSCH